MGSVPGYDLAIVGGGMVGASLAAALAGTGLSLALIESLPPEAEGHTSFDTRTTALGNASRRILESLGIWGELAAQAAPIRAIHVSDAGRFGFARLAASEQGLEAFGYVVPNAQLGAALWGRLRNTPGLALHVPATITDLRVTAEGVSFDIQAGDSAPRPASARLMVGADGAHSQVRLAAGIGALIEDYGQVAVVANVASDAPHADQAFERFTPSGPLAVLPLADGGRTVVWAVPAAEAPALLALDEAGYLARLQQAFGWRAGRFTRAGRRAAYPLRLTRAREAVGVRSVLIGNAAQALHPVAGQGFNLGLRDAAMLAECVASALDPGAAEVLERFARWRAADRRGVTRFTDGLVRLFGDTRPGVAGLRDLGLLAFDLMPPAKAALARVSLGFAGPTPRLARGLPVRRA